MKTKSNKNRTNESEMTLNGMMTFGKCENGLRYADFECCEEVEMEPFVGDCKVQVMRDGNVYITLTGYIVEDNTIYYEEEDRVIMEGNVEDGKLYLGIDGSFTYTAVLEAAKIVEIEQMPK